MNNELFNCVEDSSLTSTPNDIKILLNQIKREVEKLINDTEAKLLLHDGKIAELSLYIKTNLSNTIRCLLDSMKLSGELDSIIGEVVSGIIQGSAINVKYLGAKGDGMNDDTSIIQYAIDTYENIYIPKGEYKIKKLYIKSHVHIKGDGIENTIIKLENSLYIGNDNEISKFIELEELSINGDNTLIDIYNSYYIDIKNIQLLGNKNNIGINIDGRNLEENVDSPAYYIHINNCMLSTLFESIHIKKQANANIIESSNIYNCDYGVVIDGSNGNRIINNTIQDFINTAIVLDNTELVSYQNGTLIIGNYLEGKENDELVCGIDIKNELVKSTYIFGNKYNNLRSNSKPEIIDNGLYTTRLDYTNASPGNEVMSLPGFVRINSKPHSYRTAYVSSKLFGSIQVFADDNESGDLYYLDRKYTSSNATYEYIWRKVLAIKDNILDLDGVQIRNPQIGGGTPDKLGELCYDSYYNCMKFYNGSSVKYMQSVNTGSSSSRDSFKGTGFMMFDTTLGKPIWYTGSKWVDATGADV